MVKLGRYDVYSQSEIMEVRTATVINLSAYFRGTVITSFKREILITRSVTAPRSSALAVLERFL